MPLEGKVQVSSGFDSPGGADRRDQYWIPQATTFSRWSRANPRSGRTAHLKIRLCQVYVELRARHQLRLRLPVTRRLDTPLLQFKPG